MRKLALLFAVTVPVFATPLLGREAPPQAPAQATRPLKLALFGQSIIRYDLRRESPESAEQMTKLINGYDVAFTDFEAVLDKSDLVDGTARPASRGLIHRATSGAMESLKAMGVNMVSLANNHSFDLGEEGVFSTITGARRAGFAHSGHSGGLSLTSEHSQPEANAMRPKSIAAAVMMIVFTADCPGQRPRPWRPGRMTAC